MEVSFLLWANKSPQPASASHLQYELAEDNLNITELLELLQLQESGNSKKTNKCGYYQVTISNSTLGVRNILALKENFTRKFYKLFLLFLFLQQR